MSDLSREEKLRIFKESQEKTRKKFEEDQKKKSGSFTKVYEDINYLGLRENEYALVRILDGEYTPYDSKRLSTSPKLISRSRITGDDGKDFFCNWSSDKTWFLWKVYNKVMEYKWDKTLGEKGAPVYQNKEKYPDLFKRVSLNGKEKPSIYEKGWKPTNSIVINVIDRLDPEWNKQNKHSKLLCKKISEKDGVSYFEPGIPPTAYDQKIYDNVMEKYGFPGDYDIGIRKVISKLTKDTKTDYEVVHSKFLVDEIRIKDFIVTDFLTEEELSYGKYNFDELYRVTTYQKIYKKLKIFIALIDAQMKTSFLPELEKLVEIEKREFEKIYGKNESQEENDQDSKKEEKVEVKREEVKVEIEKVDTRKVVSNDDFSKIASYYKDLNEIDKSYIDKVENGEIVFKNTKGLAACTNQACQKKQPIEIMTCIYCGEKFK